MIEQTNPLFNSGNLTSTGLYSGNEYSKISKNGKFGRKIWKI